MATGEAATLDEGIAQALKMDDSLLIQTYDESCGLFSLDDEVRGIPLTEKASYISDL